MTSALVTGGTGFVGSFLVEELLANGRDVTCIIRKSSDLRWLRDLPVDYMTWDLVHDEPPIERLHDVDEVFHAAGLLTSTNEDAFYQVNSRTVSTLLSALHQAGVTPRRFLLVSSLAAAGPSFHRTPRIEGEPCLPVSHYGKSKREGEVRLQREAADIPYTIIRPPIVIGPRDEMVLDMVEMVTNWMVPRFGRYKKYSYVFVKDLVRGIRKAVEAETARDEIYFMSHHDNVEWEEFIRAIGEKLDVNPAVISVPDAVAPVLAYVSEHTDNLPGLKESFTRDKVREMQQPSWLCSSEKAEADVGFQPEHDIDAALDRTINWYRENGWLRDG